ncbi:MAG: hypothetical protein GX096_11835 [Clostridiales bacterium]|nr:hypothetical protein [Clostridiales bacterium]
MDHFMEEVVVKQRRGLNEVLYMLSNVMMVVMALFGMMLISLLFGEFNVIVLVLTLLMLGGAAFLFLRKDRLRTEYEYTFTNGELDFAQVFNNQKRKSLGTMRVQNVEAFGPVDSNSFRKMINMQGLKRKNWFLNRDAALYFFYYQKESNRTMIVCEPSDELVTLIRKYLPRGAYQE